MDTLFDLDSNSTDFGGVGGVLCGGLPPWQVVDGKEKSELAAVRVGKRGISEKAAKNHCEAEKRRRERINARLSTLRGLVPSIPKMDKATLLGAVITQIKELKQTAEEASKGCLIPTHSNEVRIEPLGLGDGALYFRVSICCDYKLELATDLNRAFDALKLKLVDAEVSTLGGRVKNELLLSTCQGRFNDDVYSDALQLLITSIHQSLSYVLDVSGGLEYSPKTTLTNKKRKISSDFLSSFSLRL